MKHEMSLQLQYVMLPQFTVHPADSYIIRGKSASMECEAVGADKGPFTYNFRILLGSRDTYHYRVSPLLANLGGLTLTEAVTNSACSAWADGNTVELGLNSIALPSFLPNVWPKIIIKN